MKDFSCKKCNSTDVYIREVGMQSGLYCGDCGKWIQWLGKEDLRMAKRYIEENNSKPKLYNSSAHPILCGGEHNKIRLNQDFRKDIWDRLDKCEFNLKHLKDIVQNENPVSKQDFEDWNKAKKGLIDKLDYITLELYANIVGL